MRLDTNARQSTPVTSPTVLISFSGIDGAGKSTQINHLHAQLQELGYSVRILSFWNDIARLKRVREGAGQKVFRGDAGVGTPEAPIHRRDKNVRSPAMTLVRLALYFVDSLSLCRIGRQLRGAPADVVIFDRYIYDELANLDQNNPVLRAYIYFIRNLVPRPQVVFFLDADPEQARARKPEYPIEFLHTNRRAYLGLSKLLGDVDVIEPMPMERAQSAVVRRVLSVLPNATST